MADRVVIIPAKFWSHGFWPGREGVDDPTAQFAHDFLRRGNDAGPVRAEGVGIDPILVAAEDGDRRAGRGVPDGAVLSPDAFAPYRRLLARPWQD